MNLNNRGVPALSFLGLNTAKSYRSLVDDVVGAFLIPSLEQSVLYRRAVGFFSSTALVQLSKGIAALAEHQGRIQLLASPVLSAEDIETISRSYAKRNQLAERAALAALSDGHTIQELSRLNLLAYLIEAGLLDIRLVLTANSKKLGIYHEKMGILYDGSGNKIAFAGSMNETMTGMQINYEAIDVFVSWNGDEAERIAEKEAAFLRIWNNEETGVESLDIPNVKKEILEKYRRGDIDLGIDKREFGSESSEGKHLPHENTIAGAPRKPEWLSLRKYQKDALYAWAINGYRGLFSMATGTGKTLTSLAGVVDYWTVRGGKCATIIVCPFQHLVEQWADEARKFGMRPIVAYSSSPEKNWRKNLRLAISDQRIGVASRGFFVVICTNATFASESFQEEVRRIAVDALLVVDEAHYFGASGLSPLLTERYNARLGLTATLERHFDQVGTDALRSFFGQECIRYDLGEAIRDGMLTPYEYHPVLTYLRPGELAMYDELTTEINRCWTMNGNGKRSLSTRGKRLALKRAHVVAAAASKVDALEANILPFIHDRHMLIYCGAASLFSQTDGRPNSDDEDLRQVDVITELLGNRLNMKVSQFTSKEDMNERRTLLKKFAEGTELQALVAIRCLDEGVDIPSTRIAFILASTTNPKEFVQRRGRVLRRAAGKSSARIVDFVTLPRALESVSSLTESETRKDLALVKSELARMRIFTRDALNIGAAEEIIQRISNSYRLRDDTVDWLQEGGIEE